MNTRERIDRDYIQEVKARNAATVSTLRLLRAAIKNAEIEKMKPLEEEDVLAVVSREVKKLKDSVGSFETGGRADLAGKTREEIAVMEKYLPELLSDEELKGIISRKVSGMESVTAKDFGRIMSEVMKEAKGRAEGSKVSALVKEALAGEGG